MTDPITCYRCGRPAVACFPQGPVCDPCTYVDHSDAPKQVIFGGELLDLQAYVAKLEAAFEDAHASFADTKWAEAYPLDAQEKL